MPKLPVEPFQAPRNVCRYCGCTHESRCITADDTPCHWTDVRCTICSAEDCVAAYRKLQLPMLQTLISRACVCGGVKGRKQVLCKLCWNLLPWTMSGVLFEPISRGLSVYYAEAVAYLKALREVKE
jgi:hypothetical protein